MTNPALVSISRTLDQIINTDIPARGSIAKLYAAARDLGQKPLTFSAVEALEQKVRKGSFVFIATGWVDQPLVAPGCGESDGPPGAVILARALRLALGAAPVILVDECMVEGVKKIARAAGFHCLAPEQLHHSIDNNKLLTLSVLAFPADKTAAKEKAACLLDKYKPSVCIAIERGGMNGAGKVHNMAGKEMGEEHSKLDYLFQEAAVKEICTIAIGDGGNELGMGNISSVVKECVPYGSSCQCPCGQGIAPTTTVDVLVTAAISNWGAYAIADLLALSTGELRAMHSPELEIILLRTAADAGFHDPILGWVAASVDGCEAPVHSAVVTLLQEAVKQFAHRNLPFK